VPEFPIVPWAPPPPSAEHTARCAALGLPRRADLRRAGGVTAGDQFAAYDDVAWAPDDGPPRSLCETVRASGHVPRSPAHHARGLAVRDWSLSPSGRSLAALVEHGSLTTGGTTRTLGFLVVDTRTGAVAPVEVERDALNTSLLRAFLVDDDAVGVASWQGLRLFERTLDGWRERATAPCRDAHRAAVGVHRGRVVALLGCPDETLVWALRDGAFEPLGRALTFAVDLAVTDDTLGLWITACDPLRGITPAIAERATPFALLLDEPLPAVATPRKAPKVALSLVADPALVPAGGAFAHDLAWLRHMTPGMEVLLRQREVTVDGRAVEVPAGEFIATLTQRGRWVWYVADGVVRVIDREAAAPAWEVVIPQAGRPRAVAGLDDDTVAVLQRGYGATKDEALLVCQRGFRGWQAVQRVAVRAHAHLVAHPTRPWFYLWSDQEVTLYGMVGGALAKLGAARLTAPGERRRSIVRTDGARVWVLRAVEGTKETNVPALRVDLARELVCDDGGR
jgi:hypothetical protein